MSDKNSFVYPVAIYKRLGNTAALQPQAIREAFPLAFSST